ncbi:hypothetical protein GGR56DRAFT_674225 [Xylariaceae sp. FL0804]|nr:hypothetical protein GGR56DRAFT_674225 [Xylariaceae sp. FL0804]
MAVEIVTIVNSSGKIISNGKNLISVFKEAKAAYQEKKAGLKAERAVKRSQTYDFPAEPRYDGRVEYGHHGYGQGAWERRASHDDVHVPSRASSSRRTTHRSRSQRGSAASHTRPSALTERNLRTLSETSSTAPSRPPVAYRSPYVETAPRDMTLSRPTLPPATYAVPADGAAAAAGLQRSWSDPSMREWEGERSPKGKKKKEIDMNLAYGNVPPDLADRVDLDPAYQAAQKERRARGLVERIEGLLAEAHCLHHSAAHTIQHLQADPQAAASVALTLAELSTLLRKMSPSFLAVLRGGSPAIFALLASPQFLIAAGVAVGVTVVMFGGWKIIKRIQEAKDNNNKDAAEMMAFTAAAPPAAAEAPAFVAAASGPRRPAPYPETEYSAGFDEALVVEEELSTIESWRRGIAPSDGEGDNDHAHDRYYYHDDDDGFVDYESADLELISPEADRARRRHHGDGGDAQTVRSGGARTHKSHRSHKSSSGSKHRHAVDDSVVPERRSSRAADAASEAGSHRSRRSERTATTATIRAPKKREVRAIEDGSRNGDALDVVLRPKQRDTMLKSLFKKKDKTRNKDKDDRERSRSVLA